VVEWDNLCRIFDLHPHSMGEDQVSWALEPSGVFATHSLYLRVSQGATVTFFKEVWATMVLPKIRVFLWQLIRGRLPSAEQVAKRHGPSARCVACWRIVATFSSTATSRDFCGRELGNSSHVTGIRQWSVTSFP
jgi:hypothetical protein